MPLQNKLKKTTFFRIFFECLKIPCSQKYPCKIPQSTVWRMSSREMEAVEKYVFLPDEARPKKTHKKMTITTSPKKSQLKIRSTIAAPLWHCVLPANTSTK